MVFRATPQLGPQLDDQGPFYWDKRATSFQDDSDSPTTSDAINVSPTLGTKEIGSDGGEYFLTQASAAIDATATTGTQVAVTFATWTVATGAGGFYTPPGVAVADDAYVWVRRGAYNATPA